MTNSKKNLGLQVANSILQCSLAAENGRDRISHLKLQKMLYILHGWHLAILDAPAFVDSVEAWRYGPVVRSVYNEFRGFGDDLIDRLGGDGSCVASSQEHFHKIRDIVWTKYKGLTSYELVDATHRRGTPWDIARQQGDDIIENLMIKDHYKGLLAIFREEIGLEKSPA